MDFPVDADGDNSVKLVCGRKREKATEEKTEKKVILKTR